MDFAGSYERNGSSKTSGLHCCLLASSDTRAASHELRWIKTDPDGAVGHGGLCAGFLHHLVGDVRSQRTGIIRGNKDGEKYEQHRECVDAHVDFDSRSVL